MVPSGPGGSMSCSNCGAQKSERLFRVRRSLVAALYVLAFVLAYFLTGNFLHYLIEGNDRSQLPLWQVWCPLGVLLIAVAAGTVRVRRPLCEGCGLADAASWLVPLSRQRSDRLLARGPTRRFFLRTLGAGSAAVAGSVAGFGMAIGRNRGWIPVARDFFVDKVENTAPHARPEWAESRIRNYRRLGRTNAMVSDISLGSGRINDVAIARRALERGLTYIDTAPDYADTASERVVGEAMKGYRDKVFLATKFCRAEGHLRLDTPVAD